MSASASSWPRRAGSPDVTLRGTKVLVTGADGFIGSHLVGAPGRGRRRRPRVLPVQLARLGRLARRDRRRRPGRPRHPARRHPRRALRRAAATEGIEIVFHLAALIAIPYSYVAPAVVHRHQRARHAQRARGRPRGRCPAVHPHLDERGLRHARDAADPRDPPATPRSRPTRPPRSRRTSWRCPSAAASAPGRRAAAVQHLRPAPVRAGGPAHDAPPAAGRADGGPPRAPRPAARPDLRGGHRRRLRPRGHGRRHRRARSSSSAPAGPIRSASCSPSPAGSSGWRPGPSKTRRACDPTRARSWCSSPIRRAPASGSAGRRTPSLEDGLRATIDWLRTQPATERRRTVSGSDRRIPLAEPSIGGNAAAYLEECLATNFVSSVGPFVERFERAIRRGRRGAPRRRLRQRHRGDPPGAARPGRRSGRRRPRRRPHVRRLGQPHHLRRGPAGPGRRRGGDLQPGSRAHRGGTGSPRARRASASPPRSSWSTSSAIRRLSTRSPRRQNATASRSSRTPPRPSARATPRARCRPPCRHDRPARRFSFNGNKLITTGGGGMIVTDDEALARRARHLSTQARLPGLAYDHDEVGYNYRLSNLAAALGLAQLEELDRLLTARRDDRRTLRRRHRRDRGHPRRPASAMGRPVLLAVHRCAGPARSGPARPDHRGPGRRRHRGTADLAADPRDQAVRGCGASRRRCGGPDLRERGVPALIVVAHPSTIRTASSTDSRPPSRRSRSERSVYHAAAHSKTRRLQDVRSVTLPQDPDHPMTFRAKPVVKRAQKPSWESRDRKNFYLNIGFGIVVAAAVLILVDRRGPDLLQRPPRVGRQRRRPVHHQGRVARPRRSSRRGGWIEADRAGSPPSRPPAA